MKRARASLGRPSRMERAISCPVIGARRMPLRKCPEATVRPSQPGTGPRMGRPSAEPGRRAAQAEETSA